EGGALLPPPALPDPGEAGQHARSHPGALVGLGQPCIELRRRHHDWRVNGRDGQHGRVVVPEDGVAVHGTSGLCESSISWINKNTAPAVDVKSWVLKAPESAAPEGRQTDA